MTGPEHYRMAEKLLMSASGAAFPEKLTVKAQVHATLALAAATAQANSLSEWAAVAQAPGKRI